MSLDGLAMPRRTKVPVPDVGKVDHTGRTALFYASRRGDTDVVQVFLDHGHAAQAPANAERVGTCKSYIPLLCLPKACSSDCAHSLCDPNPPLAVISNNN